MPLLTISKKRWEKFLKYGEGRLVLSNSIRVGVGARTMTYLCLKVHAGVGGICDISSNG